MGTEVQSRRPTDQMTHSEEEGPSQQATSSQRELLLRIVTLSMICLVSFSIRLFSVLRYESIIHEFDPWFNFRSTR